MFEAYSHSNHEGLIAASCIEKEVRFVINGPGGPKFDFCSSPGSGLRSDIGPCPFRASSGSPSLFNHLVSPSDETVREGYPKRRSSSEI
jgi:hypothetical protein